jgi:hypothetical protein
VLEHDLTPFTGVPSFDLQITIGATTMDGTVSKETLQPAYEVVEVAPNGLGYGEGSGSYKAREQEVGPENLQAARQAIESAEVLVPVSKDSDGNMLTDDGCGDGRGVNKIFKGLQEIFKKSLHRAKVFGGGIVMGLAGRIGVYGLTEPDLNDEMIITMDDFDAKGIDYGSHTDDSPAHQHDDNCGCGAIDKANIILGNILKYETEINGSLNVLGAPEGDRSAVFSNFAGAFEKIKDLPYSGKRTSREIKGRGKVSKELRGEHLEMFVILNDVEGMTVDQDVVRQLTDGAVEVFAVDLWRMRDIAKKQFSEDVKAQQRAELAETIYTLSTAATLTVGDLPVYLIRKAA